MRQRARGPGQIAQVPAWFSRRALRGSLETADMPKAPEYPLHAHDSVYVPLYAVLALLSIWPIGEVLHHAVSGAVYMALAAASYQTPPH